MTPPVRALVAHGSVSDAARLTALLRGDPAIAVVGEALSVDQTLALTRRLRPDVLAMGIHLPTAGGLAATRRIMIEAPTPIVIIADDGDTGQVELSVSALNSGALAVVPKPWRAPRREPDLESPHFVSTIKALSQVKVIRHRHAPEPPPVPLPSLISKPSRSMPTRVVAIAASTGGPAALQQLLSALPADFPAPILVVQHMARGFVQSLAMSLDAACALKVKLAVDGEPLLPGTVHLAPDGRHLGVGGRRRIQLMDALPVGGFMPSATVLFESVAGAFGPSAAHVILTGMGRDGVAGLAAARALGGRVIAQDEATSIVFGMPGEAVNAGVANAVLPLASISGELVSMTMGERVP